MAVLRVFAFDQGASDFSADNQEDEEDDEDTPTHKYKTLVAKWPFEYFGQDK